MYLIPRNYKDNGRIWGIFESRNMMRAIALVLPLSFLIINLTWIPWLIRAILWGVLGIFPALLLLSGMADIIFDMVSFYKDTNIFSASMERR